MSTPLALLLALGIPLLLVLSLTLLVWNHPERLPQALQRLSRREALFWNIGIGLLIALSAIRYLMGH